ncbi:glycan biosynthesis hexose transferase WsfD [Paenibacillus eucommiae]|uniref:Transmembrane protein n=1 Tax=Paenibacillus eucommiae TaxID=1355755 RepID=A0ABS4IW88_9BACL|nr:hypothetical protein [Paenibacillus eucommiae]MBP1991832.1 hypothetical protein [Paenibacillus eucommiae]
MTEKWKAQWLRSIWIRASRYISPSMFAAIGVLLITGFALFVPPYVGMADNGDFFRIIYSNGLYFNEPDYDNLRFGYFVKQYGIFQYFNENPTVVVSSQSLFIKAAIFLNKLLFSSVVFDIRFQAMMFTLLLVIAVYLLIEAVTWKVPKKRGYVIAAVAIFIFGDTAYTAYFNSFYGESIVYIMVLLMAASWLLMYRNRYNDYVMLGVFVISTLVLTMSKQQNAPVGIIAALMGLALIFIRKGKSYRLWTSFSLVLLFLSGIVAYTMISKEFVYINQYHAMTRGVLMQSANPEDAMKSFDINEQYAILKGAIYYEPFSTVDVNSKKLEEHFYSKYSFTSILAYYLVHPDQLGSIFQIAAKNSFTIRPDAMGNYEAIAGKEFGEHTGFFSIYSWFKQAATPKTLGFIVIWSLIVAGLYTPSFLRAVREKNPRRVQRLILLVTMILTGISGIIVSIIGAGDADLAKHLFLFTLAFDVVSFLTFADIVSRRLFHDEEEAVEQETRISPGNKGVSPLAAQKSV